MATRETQKLKKLIYDELTADSTLQTLLGGSGKIKHGTPLQYAEYPCVTYNITNEEDDPYSCDRIAGLARTRLSIQVFSASSASDEADDVEDQIYAILHGERLYNADILVYTAYRVGINRLFDAETKSWRVEARYELVNVAR